jgi:arsenate reductase-like glutaredoxin family protein
VDVVIYHNPECGTSRNVLAIIEAAGSYHALPKTIRLAETKGTQRDIPAFLPFAVERRAEPQR